jgi:dihydroxyacetone kinase
MTWAGPFLTSLEMPGASVTIAAVDAEMLELLSEPADVLAFPSHTRMLEAPAVLRIPPRASATRDDNRIDGVARAHASVRTIANALVRAEDELTELDRRVGDGDLGINLARGARSLLAAERDLDASSSPSALLRAVAERIRSEVGGTSGPLYSLFVLAAADALPDDREPSVADWVSAAAAGAAMVREIGGAAPGDSTMVDALQPAVDALVARGDLAAAASAAREGAAGTAQLLPSLGRSSYVGDRAVGVPDPGALAIAVQFEALASDAAKS